jgi:pimeloyl-ACP methyl ester carboxylesterase
VTISLYHEIIGETEGAVPLVLVHGGAGSIKTDWEYAIPVLSSDRPVVAVELQGHGHTPHADRAYTFENSADDIAALLREMNLHRVDIMGFSNGGPTALRFAQRHPELVRRVVVASGMCRRAGMIDDFWSNFDDPHLDDMPPELADAYRDINPDPDDLRRMFELDVALMRGFTDWNDTDIAGIGSPVLFMAGDRDVVKPEHVIEMAAEFADGRPLVVPAGHGDYLGMCHLDERDTALADACLALIRRFLDD